MSIPHQEAADALREIQQAHHQSAVAYQYQKFSPHLFLWGVIWIVGYAVEYVRPTAAPIWFALVPIGIIGSFWIGFWSKSDRSDRSAGGWQYATTAVAIFLFISILFVILPPKSEAQIGAFFPILVALFYALLGIWTRATRIALLAVVLAALTVIGYLGLPQYFLLWMAGVGGGALILGGVWLRRI